MAYQTGTVTGAQALVSALSTFMQANGWTLIDTLQASADLVFKSPGSNGKFPMIIRVSTHDKTTAFTVKALYHPSRCVPHVAFRGYHFWYTPTGTPMATPTNGTFTGATTGGSLAAGNYFYRISAIGATGETLASTEQSANVASGATGSVTLNWNTVPGAIGYNIYGRATGAEQKLLTVWGGWSTTWLDTGSAVASGALPGSNTAHGGLNEYGLVGHSIVAGINAGNSDGYLEEYRIDSATGPVTVPNNTTGWVTPAYPRTTNTNYAFTHRYTGDRYIICPALQSSTQVKIIDIATGEFFLSSGNPAGLQMLSNGWDLVYDATNDKWVIYYLTNTNFSSPDAFWKYDMDTDAHTRMPAAPWTHLANQGFVCWDGADTLYIMPGNNTTDFWKFSISTQTYTALAAAPVARSTNGFNFSTGSSSGQWYNYVPASGSTLSSDVIFTFLDDNSSSPYYCYNITTNTWNDTAHGTPNVSNPIGGQQAHSIVVIFDGMTRLYHCFKSISTQLFRLDTHSAGLGWRAGNVFDQAGTDWMPTAFYLNHTVCRLHVHNSLVSTYYFIVDQDGVKVVVNNGQLGKYYWSYFGRITSRRRAAIMTSTAPATNGTNTSITVDSSANYAVGDRIYVFDATTGLQEATTIYAIPDATHIQATLVNSYATGSLFACDPFQTVMTGDSGLACAPADPKGFKQDLHAAMYYFVPSWWNEGTNAGTPALSNLNNLFFATAPDGMNYYQPTEGLLYFVPLANYGQAFAKTGLYGTVPNVFFLPKVTGGPNSTDIVPFLGHNYLYFTQQSAIRNSVWTYGVVVGPIN